MVKPSETSADQPNIAASLDVLLLREGAALLLTPTCQRDVIPLETQRAPAALFLFSFSFLFYLIAKSGTSPIITVSASKNSDFTSLSKL